MNRQQALNLPSWEFSSLLVQAEKIRAKQNCDILMAINAGFNGNEKYHKSLIKFADPLPPAPRYKKLDDTASFKDIWGFDL